MSKLQTFLDELTDGELANFYTYRYEQFLKGSKEKIDAELDKRAMIKTRILEYVVKSVQKSTEQCPRCGSTKFYNSPEIETITYSTASVDLEVDYRTCLVCLYSEEKENNKRKSGHVGPFGFIRALINRKN